MAQPGPLKLSEHPGATGATVLCAQVDGGDTGPLETGYGVEAPCPQGMRRNQHQCLACPPGVELDALSRGSHP